MNSYKLHFIPLGGIVGVTKNMYVYEMYNDDKLKDIGLFVDPENIDDIADKILYLADEKNYVQCRKKIENFNFIHTWTQIADEFLVVCRNIKWKF